MHTHNRPFLFVVSFACLVTMLSCASFSGIVTAQPDSLEAAPAQPSDSVDNLPQNSNENSQAGEITPPPSVDGRATMPPDQPNSAQGVYEIGSPELVDLFVSPTGSDDPGNPGTDIQIPLQSITAAWSRLPISTTNTGYRVNLLEGTYPCEPLPEDVSNCINYFSDRWGTYEYPIILQAYSGAGSVTVRGGMNFNNIRYVYLIGMDMVGGGNLPTNVSGNNLLHIELGNHVLLRNLSILGPDCDNDGCNNLQEVLKVNQSQYLYVENSVIGGAWHSAVDYFVVQYGHFLNNEIHTAGQWCMYIKGGSAYLDIAGNEFHHCQLGFQSGQSANLAVMKLPWLHYETYAIKFVNNLLHDLPGVGLSAAGAYNTLFAYNTLYRVGFSSDPGYPLISMVYGERNCTPIDEIPNVIANCPILTSLGAWGPMAETVSLPAIPNRSVYFYNNLIYNPSPDQTLYTHFVIPGPLSIPDGFQNIPDPATVDQDLRFVGNVIWNGPAGMPLGIEDPGMGCDAGNATCNQQQLTGQNAINMIEPGFVNPSGGNYRLTADSISALRTITRDIPNFTWLVFNPAVPPGELSNNVSTDRAGMPRSGAAIPGAYAPDPSGRVFLPFLRR